MDSGASNPGASNPGTSRLAEGMRRAATLVASAMFAAVFAIFCLKIVMRYAAHDAMAWADEVCVVLFIWIVFWANALVLREHDHIRFDLLVRIVPPQAQRLMAVLRALLVGGVFLWALPGCVGYLMFLWRERTPVLGLPLDWVYACFGLFAVAVVARAAWSLVQLGGRSWRLHL